MVRLAVTGWLVFATLLGPWLCCCAAAAAPPKPTAGTVPPPTVASKPSCCGHKKAAEPQQKHEPQPGHGHHDCPCKAGVAKATVATAPAVEIEFLAPAGSVALPAGGLDPAAGFPVVHADRGEGPPLSADVLLHVFHNLRC